VIEQALLQLHRSFIPRAIQQNLLFHFHPLLSTNFLLVRLGCFQQKLGSWNSTKKYFSLIFTENTMEKFPAVSVLRHQTLVNNKFLVVQVPLQIWSRLISEVNQKLDQL
jgi:hypothetical protein